MVSRQDIISVREFSRRSGVPVATIARWVHIGLIKAGKRVIIGIPVSELKNIPNRKQIRSLIKKLNARP